MQLCKSHGYKLQALSSLGTPYNSITTSPQQTQRGAFIIDFQLYEYRLLATRKEIIDSVI